MHAVIRCLVAVAVASSLVVAAAPAAASPGSSGPPPPVAYVPPVDAPVSDPFRPPATPYGPGNRGLEFATAAGTAVTAAADGTVVFAGVVGGHRWVTIRHDDGVRTTYGPLDGMLVTTGEHVARGDPIGTASGPLTFTARVGEAYVDPASLFGGGPPRVRLVPEPLDRPGLKKSHGLAIPGADAVVSALDWEWRHTIVVPAVAAAHTGDDLVHNNAQALSRWIDQRATCTSWAQLPPPPAGRRFAVLVGGLGSSSTTSKGIAAVNTTALGYAAGDVVRFSYTGGRAPTATPVAPELENIDANDYGPRDTVGDLDDAGHRLATLLVAMASAVPDGAPIDVLAHSQGGLVTRVALHDLELHHPEVLHHIEVVVTMASPHRGADLALLVQAADANALDPGVFDAVRSAAGLPIAPDDPAVTQLAPGSTFIEELARDPVPPGVRFVSIAGRGDLTVPAPRAVLDGATNVMVGVDGPSAHDELPGSAGATRAIGLAIAGLGPTCASVSETVFGSTEGTLVQNAEDFLAAELE